MQAVRDLVHYFKLRWQYQAAWKGKHAVLYSGKWIELSGTRNYEPPVVQNRIWQDVHGDHYHSREIHSIWGAEDFGY